MTRFLLKKSYKISSRALSENAVYAQGAATLSILFNKRNFRSNLVWAESEEKKAEDKKVTRDRKKYLMWWKRRLWLHYGALTCNSDCDACECDSVCVAMYRILRRAWYLRKFSVFSWIEKRTKRRTSREAQAEQGQCACPFIMKRAFIRSRNNSIAVWQLRSE